MRNRYPFEYEHSIGSNLDYSFNWNKDSWLAVDEVITSSVWYTNDDNVLMTSPQNLDGVTSIFISVSESGKIYKITNTITTSAGRIDSRTLTLSCKQR